jgi:hypothetical protein
MTEKEMWERLAEQLKGIDPFETLSGGWHEAEDPEFLSLLVDALRLDTNDRVADVVQHPHYPGNDLKCHNFWCEPPLWDGCEHEENGRCPYFHNTRSCSTGGRFPIEECSRRWLNQPTYATVASSSCALVRQTRSAISSVLYESTNDSARALS